MAKNEQFSARLKEQIRIYRDSPGCSVTYADLARVVEDILDVVEDTSKEGIGFNGNE